MRQETWAIVGLLAVVAGCDQVLPYTSPDSARDRATADGGLKDVADDRPAPETGASCKPGSCLIDGQCYGPSQPNPKEPCEQCDTANPTAWTSRSDGAWCNDGQPCTFDDKCQTGHCTGTKHECPIAPCVDSVTCDGNGGCTYQVKPSQCAIPGSAGLTCQSSGGQGPTPCEVCDPTSSQQAWTQLAKPGCVITIAGDGAQGSTNGNALSARFNEPVALALDESILHISDRGNGRVRKLDLVTGQVSDAAAGMASPGGLVWNTVRGEWGLYVADGGTASVIRSISASSGKVITVAGSSPGLANANCATLGNALTAKLDGPRDIARWINDAFLVADTNNHRIRKLYFPATCDELVTYAGTVQGSANGTRSTATFNQPRGVVLVGSGSSAMVYVADTGNHSIRAIATASAPNDTVTTLAGGTKGFAEGTGTSARFDTPTDVVQDSGSTLYVADTNNHRIRKIVIAGANVTTLAGSGQPGHLDGALGTAQFNAPEGIVIGKHTAAGVTYPAIYVADTKNHRLRLIIP